MMVQLVLNLCLTLGLAYFGYRYFTLRDRLLQLELPDLPYAEGISHLLDSLEGYPDNHSIAMAEEAEKIAVHLGLTPTMVMNLKIACLLHDCGEINLPREYLRKQESLTEEEWFLLKTHPLLGELALRAGFPQGEVPCLVRWHHERWDGLGYPDQLMAEEIPVAARILAVVDAAGAMRVDRPYRKALSPSRIQQELDRQAGLQFDPRVVEARSRVVAVS